MIFVVLYLCYTIAIAAQVLSVRPAALGFHLILYIIITGILAVNRRCFLLLTPKVVGSNQRRLCLRKTVLKIVSLLSVEHPKKSRGTEETSGKYYKTPFRLHLLLEESFNSLKVNLITKDGSFEKDNFRPVVRLCSFRDALIICN